MLESLLVLGQIPGTNYAIDFNQVALSAYLIILIVFWCNRRKYALYSRQYIRLANLRRQAELDLQLLTSRQEKQTRRINEAHQVRISPHQISQVGYLTLLIAQNI
jgi:hypothetical protein